MSQQDFLFVEDVWRFFFKASSTYSAIASLAEPAALVFKQEYPRDGFLFMISLTIRTCRAPLLL